jgi:phage baseplate assembly protein W
MALTITQYSDFDIAFKAHPITKDLVKKTGANAVVQSVLNLIQTAHYEKPFHPEIGSNVRKMLFEPIDSITANHLGEEIKTVIANFEPRARVNDVYVEANETEDGYNVTIEFFIVNLTNLISVNVFLERIR